MIYIPLFMNQIHHKASIPILQMNHRSCKSHMSAHIGASRHHLRRISTPRWSDTHTHRHTHPGQLVLLSFAHTKTRYENP